MKPGSGATLDAWSILIAVSKAWGYVNTALMSSSTARKKCVWKKTEKGAGLAGNVSTDELLRNPLGYPQDVPRVMIVVPHERLASKLAFSRRITEPSCDLFLQIEMQYVDGTPSRVVQVCTQAQEKVVRHFDPALVTFAQPIFANQLVCAKRALFEVGDPK